MRATKVQSTTAFQPYCLTIEVQSEQEHRVLRALMQADVLIPSTLSSRLSDFTPLDEGALRGVMQEIAKMM